MASVSYSFNLDAVSSYQKPSGASAAPESNAAIGAKFDTAKSGVQGTPHLSGLDSPACVDGGCFIVHGDGPGVTTLSLGEEDGDSGDYIALPVIDGSLFLEPPISDFAGAVEFADPAGSVDLAGSAQYEISTLAIGEEDGGVAAAPSEIGGGSPIATDPIERRFAMEPIYDSPVSTSAVTQVASVPLGVIETTPIISNPAVTPIAKPEIAGATIESVQLATASSPLPPIQTVPIVEPRAKPIELAGSSFPLPEIKPEAIFSGVGSVGSSVTSTESVADSQYVSVGDYDSYLASIGGTETTVTSSGANGIPPATVESIKPDAVTVTYTPPPPAPAEVLPQPTINTATPVQETVVSPEIKPAAFTTVEPAALPPIQTVPIEVNPTLPPVQFASDPLITAAPTPSGSEIGGTFATIDGPVPAGKPEGIGADAPRLSDDDFRISTLALGEEDAGGG